MGNVIVFALLGVGVGALIAGLGLSIVLSYRGSGVINLAAGAIAMVTGYAYYSFRSGFFGWRVGAAPGVVLALLVACATAAVFELLVIIPLRHASPLAKLVASLGFLISSVAGVSIVFGPLDFPEPSLFSDRLVRLFGVELLLNRIWIALVVVGFGVVCICLYRFTRFGLATRAASENERNATLIGLSPRRLSVANTLLMGIASGVVGILAGTIQVLDTTDLTLLVVSGLAAALFGRLSSLTVTLVAGLGIGMVTSLLIYLSTLSWFPSDGGPGEPWPGMQELLTFVFLVIAVVARGGRIPSRGEIREAQLPPAPLARHPGRSTLVYGGIAAVFLYVFPGGYRQSLLESLIDVILLFSIVVVTGYVGQVSAAQLAIGGLAGFGTGLAAIHLQLGCVPAAILGVVAGTICGFLLAIPALRVRGVSLAIVTLAAAVAIQNFVFSNPQIAPAGYAIPVPRIFGWNFGPGASLGGLSGAEPSPIFGWVVLACVIVVALLICNLRRSRLGQELLAVRANERAASSIGINVRNVKLAGFTIAAAIAGLGGVLIALSTGTVLPSSYDTVTALSLVAFAYIGGITTIQGAVIAGMIFTGNLLTIWLQNAAGVPQTYTTLVAGLVLIAVLVWIPEGIGGVMFYGRGYAAIRAGWRRVRGPLAARHAP